MSKTVFIGNEKGGSGKTTTTLNTGAAAAEAGYKVAVLDLDNRADLTRSFGIVPRELKRTIYDVLINPDVSIGDVLITTPTGLDLIPSNRDLAGAENDLANEVGREYFLRDKLSDFARGYDLVLIDCKPALGVLMINGLAAADEVLIPLQPELYAYDTLDEFFSLIKKVQKKINPHLTIGGVLTCMYQSNTKHHQEVIQMVKAEFDVPFYTAMIKRSIHFPDSLIAAKQHGSQPPQAYSLLQFDPKSEQAAAYRQLVKEIIGDSKA